MSTTAGFICSIQESTSGFLVVVGGCPIILRGGGLVIGGSVCGCGCVTASAKTSPPSPLLVTPKFVFFF